MKVDWIYDFLPRNLWWFEVIKFPFTVLDVCFAPLKGEKHTSKTVNAFPLQTNFYYQAYLGLYNVQQRYNKDSFIHSRWSITGLKDCVETGKNTHTHTRATHTHRHVTRHTHTSHTHTHTHTHHTPHTLSHTLSHSLTHTHTHIPHTYHTHTTHIPHTHHTHITHTSHTPHTHTHV